MNSPALPLVSIVLAVHNGEATLPTALISIKNQTFTNYEVIVVDDASRDQTPTLLQQWQDQWTPQQLTILTQTANQGLTRSLVAGVMQARGKYIARLDADDMWQPTKLERQINWLETHPQYGILGCWYINRSPRGSIPVRLPTSDQAIRSKIFRENPFGHSCVVIQRSLLLAAGNYVSTLRFGQDYDLWFRLLPLTKLANIGEFLVERLHGAGLSHQNSPAQLRQSLRTIMKYLRQYHAPWWQYWGAGAVGVIYALSRIKRHLSQ
jgi:glycosyltransferase involved in cell wall biosynthesis